MGDRRALYVILLLISRATCSEVRYNQGKAVAELENLYCNICKLGWNELRSKLECSLVCSEDSRCLGFTFAKNTHECEVHSCIPKQIECTGSRPDTKFYRMNGRKQKTSIVVPPEYKYESTISGWYKIYADQKQKWEVAGSTCMDDGGHLLVIKSPSAQEWIADILTTGYPDIVKWWIDGNNNAGAADWRFYDESPMTWFRWSFQAPDATGKCIQLKSTSAYEWDDIKCDFGNGYPFICHIDEPLTIQNNDDDDD